MVTWFILALFMLGWWLALGPVGFMVGVTTLLVIGAIGGATNG